MLRSGWVCMPLWMKESVQVGVEVGGQRSVLRFFHSHDPPYFLRQGVSREFTHLAGLSAQRAPAMLLTPSHQCGGCRCVPPCLVFNLVTRDLNSGPHASAAGTLPTEPSPQLYISLLLSFKLWQRSDLEAS